MSMDEMDLTINSFLGDSRKMVEHLDGQEAITERVEARKDKQGQLEQFTGHHRLRLPEAAKDNNRWNQDQAGASETMDAHNLAPDESLEAALDKKGLRSERSVMTQQPQPTASKTQFTDLVNRNYFVNLDESADDSKPAIQKSPLK